MARDKSQKRQRRKQRRQDRKANKQRRQAGREDRREARQKRKQTRVDRKDNRRARRTERQAKRQDSKTERKALKQKNKTERAERRQSALSNFGQSLGGLAEGLIGTEGDGPGGGPLRQLLGLGPLDGGDPLEGMDTDDDQGVTEFLLAEDDVEDEETAWWQSPVVLGLGAATVIGGALFLATRD